MKAGDFCCWCGRRADLTVYDGSTICVGCHGLYRPGVADALLAVRRALPSMVNTAMMAMMDMMHGQPMSDHCRALQDMADLCSRAVAAIRGGDSI